MAVAVDGTVLVMQVQEEEAEEDREQTREEASLESYSWIPVDPNLCDGLHSQVCIYRDLLISDNMLSACRQILILLNKHGMY